MRKNFTLSFVFLFTFLQTFSQKKERELSVYTSVVNGDFFAYAPVIGREARANETSCLVAGIEYSIPLRRNLWISLGMEYASHSINVSYWMDNPFFTQLPDNHGVLRLVSLPASLRLGFLKYFFVQSGWVIDQQVKNDVYNQFSSKTDMINDQSGIGVLLKLGGQAPVGRRFTLFTSLSTTVHGLVFFHEANAGKRLVDAGVHAGLRYRFSL